MRLAFVTWLTLTFAASAQISGGTGGTGTGSSSGLGSGSGSGSGSSASSTQTAGVSSQTLLNSFPSKTGSANNSSIQTSNPFSTYYYNPYAQGLVTGTGTSTSITGFGQAVYSTSGSGAGRTGSGASGGLGMANSSGTTGSRTTGTGATGGSTGGFSGGSGGSTNSSMGTVGGAGGGGGNFGAGQQNTANRGATAANPGGTAGVGGNTNTGMGNRGTQNSFAPATASGLKSGVLYTTTIRFAVPTAAPAQMQAQLSQTIGRSTHLSQPGSVQVAFDNGTVILRGTVANDDESAHAESLMRLEPGVRDVRNELRVK